MFFSEFPGFVRNPGSMRFGKGFETGKSRKVSKSGVFECLKSGYFDTFLDFSKKWCFDTYSTFHEVW